LLPLFARVCFFLDLIEVMWISLKYERLLDVCFRCGSLGHTEAYCENERATLSNEFGFKFPAFGDLLKVDNDKVPPGIYEHPPER
jgi:hypothetical protein